LTVCRFIASRSISQRCARNGGIKRWSQRISENADE
jgi:hypothetical protein